MALSVTAVSISVSPFRIDDDDTDMFITSAPSRLPANSNDACVRVEASKNILISVRPRSEAVFFSIWRLSSTNSPARSSRPTMSSRESPSIPSKWRLLRTNEDLWAMFIKASSYRRDGRLRQADRIAVHRHGRAGGGLRFLARTRCRDCAAFSRGSRLRVRHSQPGCLWESGTSHAAQRCRGEPGADSAWAGGVAQAPLSE